MQNTFRTISKIFSPPIVPEGDGASVMRIIGTNQLRDCNPFIMMDYFSSKLPAGFPDHPHRGFETVSYMQKGSFYHEDSKGNSGKLESGDIQWMTAGKGVIHAEMPGSYDELSVGIQLWINLQAKHKMCEPQYQEIKKNNIPEVKAPGVSVKLIAGEALGMTGPIQARTPAFYMDVKMQGNSEFLQKIPIKWNSLCFIYEGAAEFSDKGATINQVVVLDNTSTNETLRVKTVNQNCSFILIAGQPINEPIVQHGPFVMNTKQEVEQAMIDYRKGQNGFENSGTWKSKIRKMNKQR